MSVPRIHEDPRVTKPYTDEQWTRILNLGDEVDELLAARRRAADDGRRADVRFDRRHGRAEWNITAMGPDKRRLAGKLFNRGWPTGLPPGRCCTTARASGIPASRCRAGSLGCYWRNRRRADLERSGLGSPETTSTMASTDDDAQRFTQRPGRAVGRGRRVRDPGLRRRLVLPLEIAAAAGQRRSARVATERSRGARPAGQSLRTGSATRSSAMPCPCGRSEGWVDVPTWESGPWFLRHEHMYLMPGDSPMGFRLPLDSLPWVAKKDLPLHWTARPVRRRASGLPRYHRTVARPGHRWPARMATPATAGRQARSPGRAAVRQSGEVGRRRRRCGLGTRRRSLEAICSERSRRKRLPPRCWVNVAQPVRAIGQSGRCARRLCVEAREGILHVFMPPVAKVEEYLHLVSAVEQTAASCRMPVRIEGYRRRTIRGCTHFKVTPDPGVIEVNLQPASNWERTGHETTTVLYEEARQSRLGHRKVHARRPPHRHRRRQPPGARRRHAGGQPVPAPPRPAGQPGHLLEQSAVACRTCSPACSSAPPARRRAWTKPGTRRFTNWKRPSRNCPAAAASSPGSSTACCATCWST